MIMKELIFNIGMTAALVSTILWWLTDFIRDDLRLSNTTMQILAGLFLTGVVVLIGSTLLLIWW